MWDNNSSTTPDNVKDIEEGITTEIHTLSDGNAHWFHIRSVDNLGHWNDTTVHIGPFWIDTTAPAFIDVEESTETDIVI